MARRPLPPPALRPFHPKRRGGGVRVVVIAHHTKVTGNTRTAPKVASRRPNGNPLRRTPPSDSGRTPILPKTPRRSLPFRDTPFRPSTPPFHVDSRTLVTSVRWTLRWSATEGSRTRPTTGTPVRYPPPSEVTPHRLDDTWRRNGRVPPPQRRRREATVSDRRVHRPVRGPLGRNVYP